MLWVGVVVEEFLELEVRCGVELVCELESCLFGGPSSQPVCAVTVTSFFCLSTLYLLFDSFEPTYCDVVLEARQENALISRRRRPQP